VNWREFWQGHCGGAEFDVDMRRAVGKLTENGAAARPTEDTIANIQIHRVGRTHRLLGRNRWYSYRCGQWYSPLKPHDGIGGMEI